MPPIFNRSLNLLSGMKKPNAQHSIRSWISISRTLWSLSAEQQHLMPSSARLFRSTKDNVKLVAKRSYLHPILILLPPAINPLHPLPNPSPTPETRILFKPFITNLNPNSSLSPLPRQNSIPVNHPFNLRKTPIRHRRNLRRLADLAAPCPKKKRPVEDKKDYVCIAPTPTMIVRIALSG